MVAGRKPAKSLDVTRSFFFLEGRAFFPSGESEHQRTQWSSRGVAVHFLDLRACSVPHGTRPQLEKLLRLHPPRLPGGAAYDVKLVLTHAVSRSRVTSSAQDGKGTSEGLGRRPLFRQCAASTPGCSDVGAGPRLKDTAGFRSCQPDDIDKGTGASLNAAWKRSYRLQRPASAQPRKTLVAGTGSWLMRRRKPKVRTEHKYRSEAEAIGSHGRQSEDEEPTTDALCVENLVEYVQETERRDPR